MALDQKVQSSILGSDISFMKEETSQIDEGTWREDEDDEGESGKKMEMKEEEIGGDGGVREERRHLYIPPWR